MIITNDCLDEMRKMNSNSISAVVTDPPYGLGFMGKKWDAGLPQDEIWKEALRICKPGSFLLAFGGTRTYHRLTCAIEDAGWEIRDCIMWIYGSGFPKSHNHFGIEGYGTALKPAYEPIIMAMKPLDETFKHNAEKWGQAGINIDGCRIGDEEIKTQAKIKGESFTHLGSGEGFNGCPESIHKGRWPANVILDEEAGKLLDEQSGITKSTSNERKNSEFKSVAKGKEYAHSTFGHSDSGGASRFFYCAKASSSERNEGLEGLPMKRVCDERASGLSSGMENNALALQRNHHPTVKPLKLMEYLVKLVMPPTGGLLLDPFAGSGTTILAARKLGFDAIGIEKSEEYSRIAKARLGAYKPEQEPLQMCLF